ncbi:MAG: prepilin-type N-terminal cleavage/methylation domain-containing protein [Candidatus Omnitrophota bacterium]
MDGYQPKKQEYNIKHVKNKLKTAGFTLVELSVTVIIVSFLMATLFAVLNFGRNIFYTNTTLLDLQQTARITLDKMVKELRQTTSSNMTITGGTQIQFKIPTDITTTPATYSSNIQYYLSGNDLIREYPAGTTSILAGNISVLSFSYASNYLTIQLTVSKNLKQRTHTFSLKERVKLRN